MQPGQEPDATVVIPGHGYDAWLVEAISSATSQTVPVRVIVVDDGSPVPLADALPDDLAAAVRVIRIPHSGLARARNAGLAQVTTPYVNFLDADDRLLPDSVERLVSEMRTHPGAVAAGGYPRYISSDGRRTGGRSEHVPVPLPMDQIRAGLLTPWPPWGAIVSTAAAKAVGGFDDDFTPANGRWWPEDLDFWARLAATGAFVHCREVVGEYRINPRGSTARNAASLAEGSAFVAARLRARGGTRSPTRRLPLATDLEAASSRVRPSTLLRRRRCVPEPQARHPAPPPAAGGAQRPAVHASTVDRDEGDQRRSLSGLR